MDRFYFRIGFVFGLGWKDGDYYGERKLEMGRVRVSVRLIWLRPIRGRTR